MLLSTQSEQKLPNRDKEGKGCIEDRNYSVLVLLIDRRRKSDGKEENCKRGSKKTLRLQVGK